MFEVFQKNFSKDFITNNSLNKVVVPDLNELFQSFSGASFNNGIYRIINVGEIDAWSEKICAVFPNFKGRIIPFGYDWLGRFFLP